MTEKISTDDKSAVLDSLALAFMGDAVYEAMVRQRTISTNPNLPVAKFNLLTVKKVRASAQSLAYDYIEPKLTDREYQVMKRGRNNNSLRCPRSSNPVEYRKATGLEALFGFLFFNEEFERLNLIFDEIFEFLEKFS